MPHRTNMKAYPASKGHPAKRAPVGKAGAKRVSAGVKHMVESGEVPNTPAGRARAVATKMNMERKGRLGPKGGYKRVRKGKG